MDAITMLSTNSLIKKLRLDYPQFNFKESDNFLWSPDDNTVYYSNKSSDCEYFAIHELSHALLDHREYKRDIVLLTMERDAWEKAKEIAKKYNIEIDDDFIQSNLDTYRDWMHKRSTCPDCSAVGLQSDKIHYKCVVCGHNWRVNEARTCALRRYKK